MSSNSSDTDGEQRSQQREGARKPASDVTKDDGGEEEEDDGGEEEEDDVGNEKASPETNMSGVISAFEQEVEEEEPNIPIIYDAGPDGSGDDMEEMSAEEDGSAGEESGEGDNEDEEDEEGASGSAGEEYGKEGSGVSEDDKEGSSRISEEASFKNMSNKNNRK
jgi:hypothetical protein